MSTREKVLREVSSVSLGVLIGLAIGEQSWWTLAAFLVVLAIHMWQRLA